MIQVTFSSSFKRAYKKLVKSNPQIQKQFDEKLKIFLNDPRDFRLKSHKLSGKLKDLWSFSINYQIRVIFYYLEKDKIVFENIGSHDWVY